MSSYLFIITCALEIIFIYCMRVVRMPHELCHSSPFLLPCSMTTLVVCNWRGCKYSEIGKHYKSSLLPSGEIVLNMFHTLRERAVLGGVENWRSRSQTFERCWLGGRWKWAHLPVLHRGWQHPQGQGKGKQPMFPKAPLILPTEKVCITV
jgi:hypothetical protein